MDSDVSSTGLPASAALDFEARIAGCLEACFRLALVMLSDRGEAEDAVQEAVLKAWRRLDQLRGTDVLPWLLGIVANECRMSRRRSWWRVVRLADPPRAGRTDDHLTLAGTDVRQAISRLPRDLRLVVALRYYLDLSLEEVAASARIPVGTVKSRLHRAASRLRKELEREEVRAA
jgi:RNA polymerase sigma-70 factor (ECF subfamily)